MRKRVKHYIPTDNKEMSIGHDENGFFIFVPEDEEDEDKMILNQKLLWLQKQGCFPTIYRRGDIWRAYVNATGNYWCDADTPLEALTKSISAWKAAGRPMDGLAVSEV